MRTRKGTIYVNYNAGSHSGIWRIPPGGAAAQFVAMPDVKNLNDLALDPSRNALYATDSGSGTVPPTGKWSVGCHFAARCQFVTAECSMAPIPLERVQHDHWSRCIHPDRVAEKSEAALA